MSKFRLIMYYPEGDIDDEGLFDTEHEAYDRASDLSAAYSEGVETLHMSNPGDFPDEDGRPDFEVVEEND